MPKTSTLERDAEHDEHLPVMRQLEFALLEIQRLFLRTYNVKFSEQGLHLTQCALLHYVGHNDPMTQTQLAELMHLGRPAVGDLIDQLEEKKLVERINEPSDRRIRVIRISARGQVQLKKVDALAKELGAKLRHGISKDERRAFMAHLEQLRVNLNAIAQADDT